MRGGPFVHSVLRAATFAFTGPVFGYLDQFGKMKVNFTRIWNLILSLFSIHQCLWPVLYETRAQAPLRAKAICSLGSLSVAARPSGVRAASLY